MTYEQPRRGQTERRENDKYSSKRLEQDSIAVASAIVCAKTRGLDIWRTRYM